MPAAGRGPRAVKITVASVAVRGRSERFDGLASEYLERLRTYAESDARVFKTSEALFTWAGKLSSRTTPVLVLLDQRGKQLTSEALAHWLRGLRDEGQQRIVFAIGPADGWSVEERSHAAMMLSLGPMTLPHELARVVVCEQLYRAFTILAGHPYHRE
jgi:23S rRNA (pseudouridine1915-N3)-methyltransferase